MTTRFAERMAIEIDGEGDPVVMIHGLGGTSNTWTPLATAFLRHKRVRLDLPGSGRSHRVEGPLSIARFVQATRRAMAAASVERAHVEEREHQFLYQDGEGFHFMNMENYDQITMQDDVIGDQAAYLHPEMKVMLAMHEGRAISIVLPQKVILEVTDTEPTTKGQTASSSYKPAILDNGVRVMVPPHIGSGTRIVVDVYERTYVGKAA